MGEQESKDIPPKIVLSQLSFPELEYYHALAHAKNKVIGDTWCQFHFDIASEMEARGLPHDGTHGCDRPFALIKGWLEDYVASIKEVPDKPLGDDYRIVLGWYSAIKSGKKIEKRIGNIQKEISEEACKRVALAIFKEMIRRGKWKFSRPEKYKENSRELFKYLISEVGVDNVPFKASLVELPEKFNPSDIDQVFLNKLSRKGIEEMWKWLHVRWSEDFPEGEVTEDYLNANIFIQIERKKRGLIDETYEDKDKLDEEARSSWQEYGLPGQKFGEKKGKPVEEPMELGSLSLDEVLDGIKNSGPVIVKGYPYSGYLCGRIVNEGKIPKDHDIDLAIRHIPDPRIIIAIRRMKPEWIFKKLHPFFDKSAASIGYSVPIYGESLNVLPLEIQKKGFYPVKEELSDLSPSGRAIIGLKPKSGFGKHEFWDTKDLWTQWGTDYINNKILIEEKVDGRRMTAYKSGDRIRLITEDTHRERTKEFPEIVEELKKIDGDWILDGEFLVFESQGIEGKNASSTRAVGDLVPREDTAAITSGKDVSEDFRKKIVFVFYDILFKDKPLVDLGAGERYKILENTIPKGSKYLDVVRGEIASTMQQFMRLVEKYRRVNGSEGVVAKSYNSKYPIKYTGENRTDEWAKIKNLKEVDVIVLASRAKEKKDTGEKLSTWIYLCGFEIPKDRLRQFDPGRIKELNGKLYSVIGKAYGTGKKASVGDIVTIKPVRIREYSEKGKIYFTWMFPFFSEIRKDKTSPDTLTTIERLAKMKTGPMPSKYKEMSDLELEEFLEKPSYIEIKFDPCPYYKDNNICPLKKRFTGPVNELSLVKVEMDILKYPIACPLATHVKCRYVKDYYYGKEAIEYSSELERETDEDIEFWNIPKTQHIQMLQKYLETPKGERDFVIQSHVRGKSQHMDLRMKVNGYLIGWSWVGGSTTDPIEPSKMIPAKGFRVEEKARQPTIWLKVKGEIPPGQAGAGVEVPGEFTILTRGKVVYGTQKVYFHEYFLKDEKYFKDWARIVIRAVNVHVQDPETKEPKKQKELLWRGMVTKDEEPYAISNRAIKKGWKPPKGSTPFPVEWAKKKFPEQYAKWEDYLKGKDGLDREIELSSIPYTLSMHSYRGPIHVRGMWIRKYYLFLGDKKSPRIFEVQDYPEGDVLAYDQGRINWKYMNWEGSTLPDSRFNKNKSLRGEMKIIDKGKVDYEQEIEGYGERIKLFFHGRILFGKWMLAQEEKNSNSYVFKKGTGLELQAVNFYLDEHEVPIKSGKKHYDIRISTETPFEFNIYGNPLESEVLQSNKKPLYNKSWLREKKEETVKVGSIDTYVNTLDSGKVEIYENNQDFVSMLFHGEKLNGYYIWKNGFFRKSFFPMALSEGNPYIGKPYDPLIIEEKKDSPFLIVRLYDIREFSRVEPQTKVKDYFKEGMPEGVTLFIGIYPVENTSGMARITHIKFDSSKWKAKEAETWIKNKKLEEWVSSKLRD